MSGLAARTAATASVSACSASLAGSKLSGSPPLTAALVGTVQVMTASRPVPGNLACRTAQARAASEDGEPSTPTTIRPAPVGTSADWVGSGVLVIGLPV